MNKRPQERMPSKETLDSLLEYNAETGKLTWKIRPSGPKRWNTRYAGKEALYVPFMGYTHGTIRGKRFLAHRIIWKLVHGIEPETVDHINGIRDDNRIANLRDVTKAENLKNKSMSSKNTSGFNGVCFHKRSGKWLAYIQKNRRRRYLGLHNTAEEAHRARKEYDPLFGFHENHGRPIKH